MLVLLLDEQISPKIARQGVLKYPGFPILTLHDWQNGLLLGADDRTVLEAAHVHKLTLVTYDLKSIPSILNEWASSTISHSGVVFIDDKTIAPCEFGRLLDALSHLWTSEKRTNWKDRVVFLTGAR